MKILLSTTPNPRHPMVLEKDFQPEQSAMLTYIPIGLLSLISSTRGDSRADVSLYELNRAIIDNRVLLGPDFYETAAVDICGTKPDMVGFMTENETYHHVLQICEAIKRVHPQCITVLGGPHASAVAAATLQSWPDIDYIVRGEGEVTFSELIETCIAGDNKPVPGVWRRSKTGQPVFGGERPLLSDLDDLPYPAYELYKPDPGEEVFFEVGRGCPFQCTFCSTAPFWRRKHRVKSAKRILEEINYVTRLYGDRRMHFTHDLFTTNKTWVREVCEMLIAAGSPVRWTCSSRTDTVTRELLDLMKEAGCSAVYFGLESGSDRVLKEIKKRIDIEQSFKIINECQEAGITPNVGFIGGLPCEDIDSFADTFEAYTRAWEMGCAPVHFFQYTPFDDSAIAPDLKDRIYTGHFLDVPLGSTLDCANRELVGSDQSIFGPYHRPRQQRGVPEFLIDGLEQFTPLVSALLMPTLATARASGGMFGLYERWIAWIAAVNEARGAASFRRYFGNPRQFTQFLLAEVANLDPAPPGLVSTLRVLQMHLEVAPPGRPGRATTMANYKTGVDHDDGPTIDLSTTIVAGDIVAWVELDEDVEDLLASRPPTALPHPRPGRTHLLWQRVATGDVRLIKVNDFLYRVTKELQGFTLPAGNVIERWALDAAACGANSDFFLLIDQLQEAARLGLVQPSSVHEGSQKHAL